MWHELYVLLKLALPVALGMAAQKFMMNTTSAVVARLGSEVLAGTVLAVNLTDMLGDIIYGVLAPLCTLVSEAVGSGQGHMAGEWLQLALAIVLAMGTPTLCIFYWGTGPFVSLTTSDPQVVEVAIMVNRLLIPGMAVLWVYTAVRLYVHGLKIVLGTSIAGFGAVFCNIFFTGLLVDGGLLQEYGFSGFGFAGAAISIDISFSLQLALACYISFVWSPSFAEQGAWGGWSSAAITSERLAVYGKQALPIAVAGLSESWGNRLLVIASGMLGANATAAYNIGNVFRGMLLSFFSGFGVAIQVQIAKKLGKRKPDAARAAFMTVAACEVVLCGLMAFGTFTFRHVIASIYSTDSELITTLMTLLPIVCIDFVLATFASTAKHTLMGMCEATIVVRSQLVSTWAVQLPLSIYFGLYSKWTTGVFGFVWGSVCGNLCMSLLLGSYILRTDWQELSDKAAERQQESLRASKSLTNEEEMADDQL